MLRKSGDPDIVLNAARCMKCAVLCVSAHRHDYQPCPCGAIAVDGGQDYLRRAGKPEDIQEESVYWVVRG